MNPGHPPLPAAAGRDRSGEALSRDRVEYRAINKQGKIFDVYPPDSSGAAKAEKLFKSLTSPVPAKSDSSADEER